MNWREKAVEFKKAGKTYNEIAELLTETTGDYYSGSKVRGYIRRNHPYLLETKQNKPDLTKLLKQGKTLNELSGITRQPIGSVLQEIEALKDKGYIVEKIGKSYRLAKQPTKEHAKINGNWNGDKVIKFGVLSDTHFGSKFVQLTHLHDAYDQMMAEGVTTVYHAGDMTEGERMRAGHEYECYVHGADEHAEEIEKNYPKRKGITTYYILGNHDAAFVKHAGLDISRMIRRDDLVCLGFDNARIELTPNCVMELTHPGGGSAYAISYKPQKMIDAMFGGEKPNIKIIGHYHKAEYLFYRNVHCLQAGTMQGQSGFMKRNSLAAHVGYWIITLHVNSDGQINRFLPEWRPFYKSIKDDYKQWR